MRLFRAWAGKHPWVGWVAVVVGLAAAAARWVFFFGADVTLTVAISAACLAGAVIAVAIQRREFKEDGASDVRPLSMQADLLFSAMPSEWRNEILAAVDSKDRKKEGFSVTVRLEDDWLVIDRVWNPLYHFEPFTARLPVAAVSEVVVGGSVVGLIGSSLTFRLASGGEVRFDVQAGAALADTVAQRFREAARTASAGGPAPPALLEVTIG